MQFLQTKWFKEEALWLSPEPDLAFRRSANALVVTHPETSPCGDAILDPTPHLTVADGASIHDVTHAESVVMQQLPVRVDSVL